MAAIWRARRPKAVLCHRHKRPAQWARQHRVRYRHSPPTALTRAQPRWTPMLTARHHNILQDLEGRCMAFRSPQGIRIWEPIHQVQLKLDKVCCGSSSVNAVDGAGSGWKGGGVLTEMADVALLKCLVLNLTRQGRWWCLQQTWKRGLYAIETTGKNLFCYFFIFI